MTDGLTTLRKLGIVLPAHKTVPFRGIRFSSTSAAVAAEFPKAWGLGVRRTALHNILTKKAEQLGVKVCWGVRVTGISTESVLLDGCSIRCRWLVRADGQSSGSVIGWAGMAWSEPRPTDSAFVATIW